MLLIFAHQTGPLPESDGRVIVRRAATRGLESRLALWLSRAARETGVRIEVNSIDTGRHAPHSRHYEGRAVDIDRVDGRAATMANMSADRLWRWFKAHDFRSGEREPWNAVLWGPVHSRRNPTGYPHNSHLHVSLSRACVRGR